jgi:hypothetical protein
VALLALLPVVSVVLLMVVPWVASPVLLMVALVILWVQKDLYLLPPKVVPLLVVPWVALVAL